MNTDVQTDPAGDTVDVLKFPLPPVRPNGRESSLRIAYVGPAHGTSLHRARALERLGHKVSLVDPWAWLGRSKWTGRWLHHAGGFGVHLLIGNRLFKSVARTHPDLIWINRGEFLGPSILRRFRTLDVPVINYTNDNPFSGRSGLKFRYYQKAVPLYDLLVVAFEENLDQARVAGARRVIRIWLVADEKAHRPQKLSPQIQKRYAADVAFIGTWMPERGPFMADLIRRGVPVSIWGDRWQKAPEWPAISAHWRGPGIYDDESYAAAIQSAKICLGLLSKGSRNLHTGRSIQIPAIGGLLCAERTAEHLALYDEGTEAVFWGDAAECAEQCHRLLADDALRAGIAARGHERALHNNLFNEPLMAGILKTAFDKSGNRR